MAKDRKFKNVVKIKEVKNINGILCCVLAASMVASGIYVISDSNQNKRLARLEADTMTIGERVAEQKAEIKKYFSNYLTSDEVKKDFVQETNISDRLFDALEAAGISTILTEEQIDEIVELAMEQMSYESILEAATSTEYRKLYNTMYNHVGQTVLNNIKNSNLLTVEQTVVYDVDSITSDVISRYNRISQSSNGSKSDAEITQEAYIKSIVENTVSNMQVDSNTRTELIRSVSNQVESYLNSHPELTVDGKDGKDGYTPVLGVDYYTDKDIKNFVEAVIPDSIEYISEQLANGADVKVTGIPGYSVDEDSLSFGIKSCKSDKTAQTFNLNVTYSRMVNGVRQESPDNPETLSVNLKGVKEIVYRENADGDDEIAVTYDNGYTESITIQSIAAKYAGIYTEKLETLTTTDFNVPVIGGASWVSYDDDETDDRGASHIIGDYYCNLHDIALHSEMQFDNEGNSKVVWGCSEDHGQASETIKELADNEVQSINFETIKNDTGKLVTDIYNMYAGETEMAEGEWNENILTGTQYSPLTQDDIINNPSNKISESYRVKAIELAKKETLARYQLILDYMDRQFVTNQAAIDEDPSVTPVTSSLFDLYQTYMADYDGEGTETYGIKSVHNIDVRAKDYYISGDVLKGFLTNENLFLRKSDNVKAPYLVEKNGTLTFNGDSVDEQLRAAQESKIVTFLMNLNDQLADSDGAIQTQLNYVLDVFNHFESIVDIFINGIASDSSIDLTNLTESGNYYLYNVTVDKNNSSSVNGESSFKNLQALYEFGRKTNMGDLSSSSPMTTVVNATATLNPTSIPETWLDFTKYDGILQGAKISIDSDKAIVSIYLDKSMVDGLKSDGQNSINIPYTIGL